MTSIHACLKGARAFFLPVVPHFTARACCAERQQQAMTAATAGLVSATPDRAFTWAVLTAVFLAQSSLKAWAMRRTSSSVAK
jgi:hypothetical protein